MNTMWMVQVNEVTRRIFQVSILSERTHKHLHGHTAAQHDQLERVREVTSIVAVLDNRWEENLSAEDRRGEKKSHTLSL